MMPTNDINLIEDEFDKKVRLQFEEWDKRWPIKDRLQKEFESKKIRWEADEHLAEVPKLMAWIDYRIPTPPKEFEDRLEAYKLSREKNGR